MPACIASAVAVGAVYDGNIGGVSFGCVDGSTSSDQVTCFSNSSTAVDLVAPGAAITSTGLGGGSVTFLGTSQAAPHVAGALALLISAGQSAAGAEAALKATGVGVTDSKSGLSFPRIDVGSAR
jgi:subtilisin family serine protease